MIKYNILHSVKYFLLYLLYHKEEPASTEFSLKYPKIQTCYVVVQYFYELLYKNPLFRLRGAQEKLHKLLLRILMQLDNLIYCTADRQLDIILDR